MPEQRGHGQFPTEPIPPRKRKGRKDRPDLLRLSAFVLLAAAALALSAMLVLGIPISAFGGRAVLALPLIVGMVFVIAMLR
jgi:hypothetical protein